MLMKAGHEGVEATGARWQIAEHQRVRARDDGTRLANVGRNSHYKFFHELTGALLDPEQVRLAKINEVEFLHTFPVYVKVCESEATGAEFVLTSWILTDERATTNLWRSSTGWYISKTNQCVTLEPDPRRIDWLREARGLNAKTRAVTTPGDKKLDNCETLLNASEATSFKSWSMRLVFCSSRHPSVEASKLTIGGWNWLKRCVRCIHEHSQWIPKKSDLNTPVQPDLHHWKVNPIFITEKSTWRASSDKAETSYEWWYKRWPTLKTWTLFCFCVFDPLEWHFCPKYCETSSFRDRNAQIDTLQDSYTKLVWESWSDNETNQRDQLFNNVRARSKYVHY